MSWWLVVLSVLSITFICDQYILRLLSIYVYQARTLNLRLLFLTVLFANEDWVTLVRRRNLLVFLFPFIALRCDMINYANMVLVEMGWDGIKWDSVLKSIIVNFNVILCFFSIFIFPLMAIMVSYSLDWRWCS